MSSGVVTEESGKEVQQACQDVIEEEKTVPSTEDTEAKPSKEKTDEVPFSEQTIVNVLLLGPMDFVASKDTMERFLQQCGIKPSKITSTVPISLDTVSTDFADDIENLQSGSHHAQYSSVKENHLDQTHSTRELRISTGNRIVSDNRRWYLTQVYYPYENDATNCSLFFNSNMKPIYYFDDSLQLNLFVLVGLAKTMNLQAYVDSENSEIVASGKKESSSSSAFSRFIVHPPFPVIVDTINGAVPFSTQELLFTNGLKDYVNLKINSGRCTRRTVCKHFDPFQKIQCRYGTNCHFIHIKDCSMDRVLQPATLYPPLRLPKLEDDLQISTCENNRRQDTLVLRYIPKDITSEDVEYMFQECEGYLASYFQRNEFYSTAIVRFDGVQNATKALLQASQNDLNVSFYGAMEDLKALLITDARECHYPAMPIERLPGDKNKAKEQEEKVRKIPLTNNDFSEHHDRGRYRSDRDSHFRHRRYPDNAPYDHGYGGDKRRRHYDTPGYGYQPRDRFHEMSQPSANPSSSETTKYAFPELPHGWTYQLNTKGSQYYFYAIGEEENTTWYHPITKQMYYP